MRCIDDSLTAIQTSKTNSWRVSRGCWRLIVSRRLGLFDSCNLLPSRLDSALLRHLLFHNIDSTDLVRRSRCRSRCRPRCCSRWAPGHVRRPHASWSHWTGPHLSARCTLLDCVDLRLRSSHFIRNTASLQAPHSVVLSLSYAAAVHQAAALAAPAEYYRDEDSSHGGANHYGGDLARSFGLTPNRPHAC